MNQPKGKNSPAAPAPAPAAAAVEAADDDMDGGFTVADGGQKMRIILDGRGVFKAMVPAGSSLPARSSMDEASARALSQIPAAKTGELPGQIPGGPAGGPGAGDQGGAGGQGAGGFKVAG